MIKMFLQPLPGLRVAAADQIDNLSFSVSTAITGSQPRGGHTQCRHWTLSSPLRTCLNKEDIIRVNCCWIWSWLTQAATFLIYSMSQVRVWTMIPGRIHNICRSAYIMYTIHCLLELSHFNNLKRRYRFRLRLGHLSTRYLYANT